MLLVVNVRRDALWRGGNFEVWYETKNLHITLQICVIMIPPAFVLVPPSLLSTDSCDHA